MFVYVEGELLGCRFWKFFEHCTVFPTLDPCPSAAEHDEDDAIQDDQTDEKSHCEPHGGLHWTEVDMWQIMVITRSCMMIHTHTDTAYSGGINSVINVNCILFTRPNIKRAAPEKGNVRRIQ